MIQRLPNYYTLFASEKEAPRPEKTRKKFLKFSLDNLLPLWYSVKAPIESASSYRGVEQLVARRAHNPEVVGSSPSPATT